MIWARRVRSARICFSIASLMSVGGLMSCSSTRFTLTPHLLVASSKMVRSFMLMVSRDVKHSSNSNSPMTFRRVVWVSFSMALGRLLIS